jgi:arylsulfatase A-like enzyme
LKDLIVLGPTRLFVTLLALWLACCGRTREAPDVILVVMDTTRADRLGVYGNPRDVSPRLDAFARDGVVFRNAWSTASWTLPSHASMFTGLYPSAHGAHITPDVDQDSLGDNPPRLAASAVTLAELLAENGYRTGAVAGAGWLAPEFGLLQGYEMQDAENLRMLSADEITDRAIAWLETVPEQESLHLMVNYFDPHDPDPPEGFGGFPGEQVPVEPATLDAERGALVSEEQRSARVDRYDGSIRFVDFHIGRLFDALRVAGRYQNALIIVTADHGEHFGEHGALGHGAWLYEEVLHVPLLVHLPEGRDAGLEVEEPISHVDLLPLVASEVGFPLPEAVDSSAPGEPRVLLAEEFPSGTLKKLFGEHIDRDLVAGIRWPWKLIVSSTGTTELYRLDEDPGELTRVENQRVEAEIGREIQRTLESLQPTAPDHQPRPMSPESKARLRELGYLE